MATVWTGGTVVLCCTSVVAVACLVIAWYWRPSVGDAGADLKTQGKQFDKLESFVYKNRAKLRPVF